ncbi:MAG TPA: hypothetical protein VHE35_15555 [Kofleriaceae bacterium]|nr:hypothetical protein [Kofleriaceae bacterium]
MSADAALPAEAERVRIVEVRPPSVAEETRLAVVAVLQIAFWSAIVIGAEYGEVHRHDGAGGPKIEVNYDEVAFKTLPPEDQRLSGLIGEGMTSLELERSRAKAWPTVETMAGQGVPPFARDPIDRGAYTWTLLHDGTLTDYVGVPAPGSGRASFAIVFIEPEPGTPVDPNALVDEVHHRLSDGTMIHASFWRGPTGSTLTAATDRPPPEDGWRRVTRGS